MSSGDGWATCAAGHRHWGRYGAAGLLLIDGDRVILQHRAPWTHEGDSWGVPGGARNREEDALAAAVREAGEEASLTSADVYPIGLYVDDHGGWAYTTVVARPTRPLNPVAANAESLAVSWQPIATVSSLRLHNGFAAAWQHLRDVPPPLYLVVHPRLRHDSRVATLGRDGVAVDRLPFGMRGGGLDRLLPHIVRAETEDEAAAAAAYLAGWAQVLVSSDPADLTLLC